MKATGGFSWKRVGLYLAFSFVLILIFVPQSKVIIKGFFETYLPGKRDRAIKKHNQFALEQKQFAKIFWPRLETKIAECREKVNSLSFEGYYEIYSTKWFNHHGRRKKKAQDMPCRLLSCEADKDCTLGYAHNIDCTSTITPVQRGAVFMMHHFLPEGMDPCYLPNLLKPPTADGKLICEKGKCSLIQSSVNQVDVCNRFEVEESVSKGCFENKKDSCFQWLAHLYEKNMDSQQVQNQLCQLGEKLYCYEPNGIDDPELADQLFSIRLACVNKQAAACFELGIWVFHSDQEMARATLLSTCELDEKYCKRVIDFYESTFAREARNQFIDEANKLYPNRLEKDPHVGIEQVKSSFKYLHHCSRYDSNSSHLKMEWDNNVKKNRMRIYGN